MCDTAETSAYSEFVAKACLPDYMSSQLRFAVVYRKNRKTLDYIVHKNEVSIQQSHIGLQSEKLAASPLASPTNSKALPNS